MKNFIEKNFVMIVLIISLFTFFKGCGDSRELSKLKNQMVDVRNDVENYSNRQYDKDEFEKKLRIMSLETELRFIEATDRKMLDVQRQSQIRDELKKLKE